MNSNSKVITIPVQFQEAGKSMSRIVETLKKGMREVDLESGLGKKLTGLMKSLQNQLDDYTQLTLEPTIDEAGMRKAQQMIQKFVRNAGKIDTSISQGGVFDFNLSKSEIGEIDTLRDKVRKLNAELERLKKNGSTRATDSYLQEIGESDFLDRARRAGKTFKSDATLSKNASALEAETKQAQDNIIRLQKEQAELQQKSNNLQNQLTQQQAALKQAQAQRARSEAIVNKGNYLTAFEAFDYKGLHTEGGQMRGQTAVLNRFMDALMKDSVGGRIASQNTKGAEIILKQLGFDPAAIQTILQQNAPQIRQAIAKALDISDGSGDAISVQAYDKLQDVQRSANQYMRRHATAARYEQFEQEKQVVSTAQSAVDKTKVEYNKTNKAIAEKNTEVKKLQAMATELEEVTKGLAAFSDALNQAEAAALQNNIDSAKTNLSNKKQEIKGRHIGKTDGLQGLMGAARDSGDRGLGIGTDEFSAQKESEQFTANLKQSIKHWMSAYQIINMVKNGIRQAYQDIKSLDTAMTNIAVVTDMSTDELWGKINDYMAIAQQYGVTTQGVYEVSQLYYQQGLATNEVMAATTETLKMARIAGMDYKDAADAMTVAVRAFKMEMSDAGHVTDVYSKVAAVTASDTEELAIAMSKTASSAESVGSSFENTTAMLAVMIETTRESAQNLGSALKSIISRYGEMKIGLTVDSEGEELDYNKVDTALKSVGISIKDAQGQFRDFDEVIFELSEKWDSLDKNTQRYIATIMAGNRQQSRFIALVDNWERLDEVSQAAADSQDASLLQYAKTLDSLDTKLNNIKTSFQQFYMDIFNGPFFKGILDFINSVLIGFNKLGQWQSILNIAGLIRGIKLIGGVLANKLSKPLESMYTKYKSHFQRITKLARQSGEEAGREHAVAMDRKSGEVLGSSSSGTGSARRYRSARHQKTKTSLDSNKWGTTKGGRNIGGVVSLVGSAIGAGMSAWGSSIAEKNSGLGAAVSTVGNMASGAATGATFGPWGAVAGGIVGLVSSMPALTKALDKNTQAEEKLAELQKDAEEKNIERAEKKEDYNSLKQLLDKYNEYKESKFDSDENYQNWIDVNNQLVEKYPELIGYIDEEGNAIANVTNATEILKESMIQAAEASRTYYRAKVEEIKNGIEYNKDYQYTLSDDFAGLYLNFLEEIGAYKTGATGMAQAIGLENAYGFTNEQLFNWLNKRGLKITDFANYEQSENSDISYIGAMLKNFKVLKKNDEGYYEVASESYLNYQKAAQQKVLLGSYSKASAISNLSLLSSYDNADNNIAKIEGYQDILYNYLKIKNKLDDSLISELTIESVAWKEAIPALEEFYTKLSPNDQSFFNSLYGNLTKYSDIDLSNILSNLNAPKELQEAFMAEWYDRNYNILYRVLGSLYGEESILSFEEYKDAFGQDITKEYYYSQYLKKQVDILGEENIIDFLYNADSESLQNYLNYVNSIDNDLKTMQGKKAEERKKWIDQQLNNIYANGSIFIDDPILAAEFTNLLTMDAGTQEWADAINDFSEEYGLNLDDASNYVFENFSTFLAQLGGRIDKTVEEIDKIVSVQSKGMNLSEAEKYFKKYATDGQKWTDLFEVTADGLYIFKDIEKILDAEYENLNETATEYETHISELKDVLSIYFSDSNGEIDLKAFKAREDLQIWLKSAGFTDPQIDNITNYLATNTEATYAQFIDYLDSQGIALKNASEYYQRYKDKVLEEEELRKIKDILNNQTKDTKDFTFAISKGATSLSKDDFAQLAQDLGIDVEKDTYAYVYDAINDTYSLTEEYLKSLGGPTGQYLNADFKDNVKKSQQEFLQLYWKSLTDSLTGTEILRFNQLKTSSDVAVLGLENFAGNYDKYINGIVKAYTGEEQISKLKEAYSKILEKAFKKDEGDLLRDIAKSEGSYSFDTISEMLANTLKDNGERITEADITKWFKVDELTGELVLAAGVVLSDLPKSVQAAVEKSETTKAISEAIDADNLGRTLGKEIGELLGNATEVSLEQLKSLYEKIFGENSFNGDALKEVQGAIAKGAEGIEEYLKNMIAFAIAKGIPIENQELIDTLADAKRGIVKNIQGWLASLTQGALSNTDYTSMLESLGLEREDFNKYVTETYEGMQVTAEGALAFAAKYTQVFGDSAEVAENLLSTLQGSGLVRTVKDVETLIKKVKNDTETWGDNCEVVLKLLENIRAELDQLPTNEKFDFMNFDIFGVGDDTFESFANSVSTAISALNGAFEEGGKINYKSFSQLIAWMENTLSEKAADNFLGIKGGLKAFASEVMTTIDALGNVDMQAAIKNMGIDMGLEEMAGGFDKAIQELAKEQVEYWKNYKAFLEGVKELQEAGNGNELSLSPVIDTPKDKRQEYLDSHKSFLNNFFSEEDNPVAQLQNYFNEMNIDIENLSKEEWKHYWAIIDDFLNNLTKNPNPGSGSTKINFTPPVVTAKDTTTSLDEDDFITQFMEKQGFKQAGEFWTLGDAPDVQVKAEFDEAGALQLRFKEGAPEETKKEIIKQLGLSGSGNGPYVYQMGQGSKFIAVPGAGSTVDLVTTNITPTEEPLSIADILKDWTSTDGKVYTKTLPDGTTLKYEATTEQLFIKSPDGSYNPWLSGLSATEVAKLVNGEGQVDDWKVDGSKIYYNLSAGENSIQFEYEAATGKVHLLNPDGSHSDWEGDLKDIKDLEGMGDWSSEEGSNILTKSLGNGYSLVYNLETGQIQIEDPTGAKIDWKGSLSEVKDFLNSNTWKAEGESTLVNNLGNGYSLVYSLETGELIVKDPTGAQTTLDKLTKEEFLAKVKSWSPDKWADSDGGLVYDLGNGYGLFYKVNAGLIVAPTGTVNNVEGLSVGKDGTIQGLTATAQVTLEIANKEAFQAELNGFKTTPEGNQNNTPSYSLKVEEAAFAAMLASSGDNFEKTLFEIKKNQDTGVWEYQKEYINKGLAHAINRGEIVTYEDFLLRAKELNEYENQEIQKYTEAYKKGYYSSSPYEEETPFTRKNLETALRTFGYTEEEIASYINGITEDMMKAAQPAVRDVVDYAFTEGYKNFDSQAPMYDQVPEIVDWLTGMSQLYGTDFINRELFEQSPNWHMFNEDDYYYDVFVTEILNQYNQAQQTIKDNPVTPETDVTDMTQELESFYQTWTTKPLRIPVHIIAPGLYYKDRNEDGSAGYAGNVSGLALYNGANFANKTLVGELGPELAVYDNMYHLLGQNGAEFVNLPDDAIVFNHRQTEGIIKGQAGYRGKALVNGNVSGPAYAGGKTGIDAAIDAVDKIIDLWSNLSDGSKIEDLLGAAGGSGGGGGDNSIKAHIEDLEEWYNLLRQIANLEQKINNLEAERENITDGHLYLRNLREAQYLLEKQATTQEILLDYQQKQLKLQADQINQNKIWSKFLTVNDEGLLQYVHGNETNGGKGALSVLQQLNEMSGKDQLAYIKKLGYSYTDTDGNKLKGEDLVAQFFEELQGQIDAYDSLYDTVNETTETLEGLETAIEDVNEEIRDNQLSLETAVYDAIVNQREKEIEQLKEQNDLIKEANEAYINGIQEAISTERDMYEREKDTSDREQLQRRLNLLRMSGGSASEIADLEAQLDETLKNEYFSRQEESLKAIQDANDKQIERMDTQIRLMEENLAYEQEMGLLWRQVYEVLAGSDEKILNFISQNTAEFISKSTLEQKGMLTNWAKEIGIYKEDQAFKYNKQQGEAIWGQNSGTYSSALKGLTGEQTTKVADAYSSAFANAKASGLGDTEAAAKAWESVQGTIQNYKNQNTAPKATSSSSGSSSSSSSGKKYKNVTVTVSGNGSPKLKGAGKEGTRIVVPAGTTVTITVADDYIFESLTYGYKGDKKTDPHITVSGNYDTVPVKVKCRKAKYGYIIKEYGKEVEKSGGKYDSSAKAEEAAKLFRDANYPAGVYSIKKYSTGGLADFTGLAQLDGTPSEPEAVLNPKQTKAFIELVENYRKLAQFDNPLVSYMGTYGARVGANIAGAHMDDNSNNVTIAPGAVQIAVAQLNDKYDVEELANDVMNRMVVIANKSTNRSVNRR